MKYEGAYQGGVMSFEDIAKAMGITTQGANRLYHSAIAKLQKKLRLHKLDELQGLVRMKDLTKSGVLTGTHELLRTN